MKTDLPLTPRAATALTRAQEIAKQSNHGYVGSEVLFLGLLDQVKGITSALEAAGINVKHIRDVVAKAVRALERTTSSPAEETSSTGTTSGSIVYATGFVGGPSPAVKPPQPRFYLFLDDSGIGSLTVLLKVSEHEMKGVNVPYADSLQVPNDLRNRAFLSNVFAREPSGQGRRFNSSLGTLWGTVWSLSEQEYNRIAKLIELTPAKNEWDKLAGYYV